MSAESDNREYIQGKPLPKMPPRKVMELIKVSAHNNYNTEDKTLEFVANRTKEDLFSPDQVDGSTYFSHIVKDNSLTKTAVAIIERATNKQLFSLNEKGENYLTQAIKAGNASAIYLLIDKASPKELNEGRPSALQVAIDIASGADEKLANIAKQAASSIMEKTETPLPIAAKNNLGEKVVHSEQSIIPIKEQKILVGNER